MPQYQYQYNQSIKNFKEPHTSTPAWAANTCVAETVIQLVPPPTPAVGVTITKHPAPNSHKHAQTLLHIEIPSADFRLPQRREKEKKETDRNRPR